MKGQIFVLLAFVICLMIAELGNLYVYSDLPAQTEQTKTSELTDLFKNIQNEIVYVSYINPDNSSDLDDFKLFVGNFTQQKSFWTNFSS